MEHTAEPNWCRPQGLCRAPPPILSLHPGSGPSVVIWWAPPLGCSESSSDSQGASVEIEGYRLQFGLKNSSLDTTVDFTGREKNFSVSNLSSGSSYVFVLSAKSRASYSEALKQEIIIPEYPPLGYPKITDFVNVTCCSLQFFWLPPAPKECNSVITEYNSLQRGWCSQTFCCTCPLCLTTPPHRPTPGHITSKQVQLHHPGSQSQYSLQGADQSPH